LIDTFNYKRVNNPKARETILSIIEEKELVDVWRVLHENEKQYTWHHKNPIKMSRLDFFLASEDIFSLVTDAKILPKYKSDHSPVQIKLQISKHSSGKGNWEFNNSLLSDTTFVKLIKDHITLIKQQYAVSPYNLDFIKICPDKNLQFQISDQLFFETLLVQLRGNIISYSAKKKRVRQYTEHKLEKQIEEIDYQIKQEPQNYSKFIEKLEEINLELEQIRKEKYRDI